ncbi:MAG: hypothetical protein CSA26_08050 [Desulfobacterales bacterium]|nr:MAG: hypothetical protein CSA26_08050 [Desulfobacterales bacterium]
MENKKITLIIFHGERVIQLLIFYGMVHMRNSQACSGRRCFFITRTSSFSSLFLVALFTALCYLSCSCEKRWCGLFYHEFRVCLPRGMFCMGRLTF